MVWSGPIPQWVRSAVKPPCISQAAERASQRACGWAGQSFASGYRSAAQTEIAMESQIVSPSTFSSGTRREGEMRASSA